MKSHMSVYRAGIGVGFVVMLVLLAGLVSCATTSACPPEPDWMGNPEQAGYYVGVGAADSGNQAEDRSVAEARARADLAARISSEISSELNVRTSGSSSGEYAQQVEELVHQSVDTNVQEIETVDTYYCHSTGYWVYVRLSKAKWDAIQSKRRQKMVNRVNDLLEPVLTDNASAFALRVERLARSLELLREASFGQEINASIAGKSGNMNDVILNSIQSHIDSLTITLSRHRIDVHIGEPFTVQGRLTSDLTERIGTVPVAIYNKAGRNVEETNTDAQGDFIVQMPSGLDEAGERTFVVSARLEMLEAVRKQEVRIAHEELAVSVNRIEAGLLVEVKNSKVDRSLDSEIRALFSDKRLPFTFSPEKRSNGYNVRVELLVEDFPKYLEEAPDMAKAWAVISLEHEGSSIYSYESEFVKDGGLNPIQAHSRVLSKLLTKLRTEDELYENLRSALLGS